MGLTVNGTTITGVVANGVTMDEVWANGVKVWTRFVLADNVPNISASANAPFFTSRADTYFRTDGSSQGYTQASGTPVNGSWGLPAISGIGSDYELQLTYTDTSGGSRTLTAPTSTAWTRLNADVLVRLANSSNSADTWAIAFTFKLRKYPSGSPLLTGTFTLNASINE